MELDEGELHEIDDLRSHILEFAHDLESMLSSSAQEHGRHHRQSVVKPRHTAMSRLTINPTRPRDTLREEASDRSEGRDSNKSVKAANEGGAFSRVAAELSSHDTGVDPWAKRRARQEELCARRISRLSQARTTQVRGTRADLSEISRPSNRWVERPMIGLDAAKKQSPTFSSLGAAVARPTSRVSRGSNRWGENSFAAGMISFGLGVRKRKDAGPSPPASPPEDPSPPPDLASKTAANQTNAPSGATSYANSDASSLQAEISDIEMSILGISKRDVPVRLEWRHLSFDIKASKVLSNLSGHVMHGEMTALMGESGSGKSTLLNVLGGRAGYGTPSGSIELNGEPYHPERLQHMIGFVLQSYDNLFGELTVFECLMLSAQLRAPRTESLASISHRVATMLELLGLHDVAHFVLDKDVGVGRLSGGQMRRVGIGVELAADPSILLLDEPTSALDAVNTHLVVGLMRSLADSGMMLIASIHQPRFAAYQMFDRLLLLRQGELVYSGSAGERATEYFGGLGFHVPSHVNPADYFIEVCFGLQESSNKPPTEVDELAALWRDEYARLLQEEEDERKAQGEAPSDRAEFKAWFLNHRMYHTLAPSLADAVYTSLDVPHTKKPSWVALHKALASWRMPAANTPNWLAQFMICFRRYLLKRLRLRKRLSAQLFFMILLAVVSGLGQGPDVPQTAVMLVGCISLFCTFITTCSIESVLQGDSAALFEHESASGIRQSAEIVARILGDLLIWMPAPLLYGMPYLGLANMRGAEERLRFYGMLYMLAFAMQPFAYLATLASRSNAVIIVSSVAMILSIFLSGHVGPNLKDSPTMLALSPPCWALHAFCLTYLSSLPFDMSRIAFARFLVRQNVLLPPGNSTLGDLHYLVSHSHSDRLLAHMGRCHEERAMRGITPFYNGSSVEGDLLTKVEAGDVEIDAWYRDDLMALIIFGVVLRVLTIVVFVYQTARRGSLLPCRGKTIQKQQRQQEPDTKVTTLDKRKVRGTIIKSSRFSVNTLRLNRTAGLGPEPKDTVGFKDNSDLELGVHLSFMPQDRISRVPMPPSSDDQPGQPPSRLPPVNMMNLSRITEKDSAESLLRSTTPRDDYGSSVLSNSVEF